MELIEDVLINVLLRLPVVSLLRFKLVCKSWQSIISSSRFVTDHYDRPSNPTCLVVHGRNFKFHGDQPVLDYARPFPELFHSIALFPDATFKNPVDVDNGVFRRTHVHSIVGPCNGIFCVCLGNNNLALWNPATRKMWSLPCDSLPAKARDVFSFWVDPITNDFKIFLFQSLCKYVDHYRFARYASRNDSWKYFEREEFNPGMSHGYSVLKGHYYFLRSYTRADIIIAFDIFDDSFHEIQGPAIDSSRKAITLDIYDDSLALFASERVEEINVTEIWLMKENGFWTKLRNVVLPKRMEPVRFWNRNELFILRSYSENCLMIFDMSSGKTRRLLNGTSFVDVAEDVEGVDENIRLQFFPLPYKESLLSIKKI